MNFRFSLIQSFIALTIEHRHRIGNLKGQALSGDGDGIAMVNFDPKGEPEKHPDPFGSDPGNQSPPFFGRNLFTSDPLMMALANGLGQANVQELIDFGQQCGTQEAFQLADLANRHKPDLKTHDEQGRRIDQVEFHPAYHALMRRSIRAGLKSSVWESETENKKASGPQHQIRALMFYLAAQLECGHLCPITMTHAAPAALKHAPSLVADWLPGIASRHYDPSSRSPFEKKGITIGMGMTEKQGGTDVRGNVTRAVPANSALWLISGHKWFLSAPMCDAFLVLAQTNAGLSCFMVPRTLPEGKTNNLRFQRLKDKLGNVSNASSEVEFHQSAGFLIGADGHGIRTILDMVTLTRLDCALASAGIMRISLAQAVHHSRHRSVFQKKLIDQPLAHSVMADLALDCAGASVLCLRLAEAFDQAAFNEAEALFARLMTPAVKYWVCKATPAFTAEAMECMGGNGYIEDWPMARYYREAPVNAIWEGSGNVMCLDVLRAIRSAPQSIEVVLAMMDACFQGKQKKVIDPIRASAVEALKNEGAARKLTENLALGVAAAELHRLARQDIADAFLETRLFSHHGLYGTLDSKFNSRGIVDAMYPEI